VSFYERREVKDLIAYLRLLVNPADDEAFLRIVNVPRRGIGLASLRTLAQAAAAWSKPLLATAAIADRVVDIRPQTKRALTAFAALLDALRQEVAAAPVGMALDRIIAATEYERYLAEEGPGGADRLENVRELLSAAAEWLEEAPPEDGVSPIEQFLQQAALTTSVEQSTGDPSGVTLMTVHTAKGLEFPITFIAGLEDGLFPLSRVLDTPEGAEEERRLAYVAMTRARDRLYVTWARSRRRGGQIMPGAPSRFLNAIPPAVLDTRRTTGLLGADWAMAPGASRWGRVAPDPVYDSQLAPRFVKGERVHHRQFGSGVIRELSGQGRSLKVLVEFEDENVGTKHLLAAYAGLERDAEGA
jgi:DNA helicase-2/ATP-dependent DNA helicase PcrA